MVDTVQRGKLLLWPPHLQQSAYVSYVMSAVSQVKRCVHALVLVAIIGHGRSKTVLKPKEDKYLLPEDFKRATSIRYFDAPKGGNDPTIKAGKFEGDIDLGGYNIDRYADGLIQPRQSGPIPQLDEPDNSTKMLWRTWPDNKIPYVIDKTKLNAKRRSIIAAAMQEFTRNTCIRWIPKIPRYLKHRTYVKFTDEGSCFSRLGKIWGGGAQPISIGKGCAYKGVVMHEMMHALGFLHEQGRFDRDYYVTIKWPNIKRKEKKNFLKYMVVRISELQMPYDHLSLMHYKGKAFSKNGLSTVVAKTIAYNNVGRRTGFSTMDIERVNKLYKCDKPKRGGCIDRTSHCKFWSPNGWCNKEKRFMARHCRKSCNWCGKIVLASECQDIVKTCEDLKRRRGCGEMVDQEHMKEYMEQFCKRTCGHCSKYVL